MVIHTGFSTALHDGSGLQQGRVSAFSTIAAWRLVWSKFCFFGCSWWPSGSS